MSSNCTCNCNNCNNCNTCKKSATPSCSTTCPTTVNTDCVFYNKSLLDFELSTVDPATSRSLTSLLQKIISNTSALELETKFLNFNSDGETDEGIAYTVLLEDTEKVLLLKQTDAGEDNVEYTITLPETTAFIGKQLIFKDISADSGSTTITFLFSPSIQYDWNPTSVTNEFSVLMDTTHKTLKLRFLQVTPTSYKWVVCP